MAIEKTGIREDLLTIKEEFQDDFPNIIFVSRSFANYIAEYFLDSPQRQDFLPANLRNEKAHTDLTRCWSKILSIFKKKYNIKILVESNWTYGNTRDSHPAAITNGIAVIIIYKECYMSSYESRMIINNLKVIKPFEGTLIITYNQEELQRHLTADVVARNQIVSCGSPRFDSLLLKNQKMREFPNNKKSIVFLIPDKYSEEELNKFPAEYREFQNRMDNYRTEIITMMIDAAWRMPQFDFIIKTKVTSSTINFVNLMLTGKKLPSNIQVINGKLAPSVLNNTFAAITFHSTATVDCIAANIKTASWSDYCYDRRNDHFRIETPIELVTPIQGLEEFCRWIIANESNNNEELRLVFLDNSVGNSDGKSSIRVFEKFNFYLRD